MTVETLIQAIGNGLAVAGVWGVLLAVKRIGRTFSENRASAETDPISRIVARHAAKNAPTAVFRHFRGILFWWLVLLAGVFLSVAATWTKNG